MSLIPDKKYWTAAGIYHDTTNLAGFVYQRWSSDISLKHSGFLLSPFCGHISKTKNIENSDLAWSKFATVKTHVEHFIFSNCFFSHGRTLSNYDLHELTGQNLQPWVSMLGLLGRFVLLGLLGGFRWLGLLGGFRWLRLHGGNRWLRLHGGIRWLSHLGWVGCQGHVGRLVCLSLWRVVCLTLILQVFSVHGEGVSKPRAVSSQSWGVCRKFS